MTMPKLVGSKGDRPTLPGLGSWAGRLALAAILASGAVTAARSADAVSTLAGSWSGSGRLHYTDGRAESIHCTASYTGGGNELRMAIQCKSETNPIHLRSRLKITGGKASGEWEERTFNASGEATGTSADGTLKLAVSGGAFTGTMTVTYGKSEHAIAITTQGIGMSRASISFKR